MVSKEINNKNQEEIVRVGRTRWKIENQGFNVQKNHGYFLTHAFSENYNAMKNHYILAQIAHIIRQLMENGIEIFKKYKRQLKEISFKLLEIFRNRKLNEEEKKEIFIKCQIRFNFEDTS